MPQPQITATDSQTAQKIPPQQNNTVCVCVPACVQPVLSDAVKRDSLSGPLTLWRFINLSAVKYCEL